MNLRGRRRNDVDINVIPLIDVMFMLVIFFVVSTTFERRSEINITLPEASQDISETELDVVDVGIDAQGLVFINGEPLINSKLMTIREALRDASIDMKDAPVVISADAGVSHQAVVKVMDAARQIGLVHITFTTQKIEDENSE